MQVIQKNMYCYPVIKKMHVTKESFVEKLY